MQVGRRGVNPALHVALGEVAGVYLITDTETGDQYVGSAWGEGGILGRWMAYVRSGHGGNQRLRAALGPSARRRHALQFSILRPMPRSAPQRKVVAAEAAFKRKLGTRAHGLNAN